MTAFGIMGSRDPWFRIGRLEVSTTVFVLLLLAASVLVWVAEGPGRPVTSALALWTWDVSTGEVWRLVTWPFATDFSLWLIISAWVFLFSASDLEREIGRRDFLILLIGTILILGAAYYGAARLFDVQDGLAGFHLLAFTMLLLYCAEHPDRPILFSIRAWMLGLAFLVYRVIIDLAAREWDDLAGMVVGLALIALLARSLGLFTMYDFIPRIGLPARREKPKRSRGEKRAKKRRRKSHLAAVPDAPPPPREPEPFQRKEADLPPADTTPSETEDELAMDALLDKISEGGLASLTDDERDQLEELRQRRSRRR